MEQLFAVFLGNVPVEIQEHRHVEHHLDGGEAEQFEIDPEVGAERIGNEQIEPAQGHEIEHEGQVEAGSDLRQFRGRFQRCVPSPHQLAEKKEQLEIGLIMDVRWF